MATRGLQCADETVQALLAQLTLMLEFEGRMQLLDNAITVASFSLLLRDSMSLYAALMMGFLRVTNEYTEMCKREVEDAADLYEKFVDLSEKVTGSPRSCCIAAHTASRTTRPSTRFTPSASGSRPSCPTLSPRPRRCSG